MGVGHDANSEGYVVQEFLHGADMRTQTLEAMVCPVP